MPDLITTWWLSKNILSLQLCDMVRILVPCDFSPASDKPIRFAINLAEKVEELFLLNLFDDNSAPKKLEQNFKQAGLNLKI
ncbi:universal stress protein [Dyadobacter psychrotolerans]|uniref:Universal stress protein n=1 Tax=Dyadobacter psychrotolerans TaxID=2541721 RepID=A0A4R5E0Y8_9BACT|nr:universal stress protein [Dyadobacter psychrotolerans]TDE17313.1 hypothetical protein E0F88_05330 [Dyadobacter psychrotolerans]